MEVWLDEQTPDALKVKAFILADLIHSYVLKGQDVLEYQIENFDHVIKWLRKLGKRELAKEFKKMKDKLVRLCKRIDKYQKELGELLYKMKDLEYFYYHCFGEASDELSFDLYDYGDCFFNSDCP